MPFTLECPIPPRERLLVYGVEGTGKSKGLLDIARRVTDGKFYIMDNDLSYERLLYTGYLDVAERGNVVIENYDTTEWGLYIPQINEWRKVAGRNDWLVLDSTTPTWSAVSSWYSDQLFGKDKAAHMLQLKKDSKSDREFHKAMSDSMNYTIINAEYFKLYAVLARWPGHVYLTAEQDTIREEDEKGTRDVYGPIGFKPKGQKAIGHRTNTVLWMSRNRAGEWLMSTMKDRGREYMNKVVTTDFAADYLQGIAGWKMAKVD